MERLSYIHLIEEKFKAHKIVALLGPRQSGKTTIAKAYTRKDPSFPNLNYFDLEDTDDLVRLQNPMQALLELKGLIVIDEVQRVPNLFPILRVLHDRDDTRRFLILGSASKMLLQQSAETLTGRIHYEEITPLALSEVDDWRKLWFRGGFPRSYLAETDDISGEWRENYIRTLLEQDIPNLGFRIPSLQLRRFWMALANHQGQIFNAHQMANGLEMSPSSMSRYLDLMHDMLVVRVLPPWFENMGKRQVKMPKAYIRDSGLYHSLVRLNAHDDFVRSEKRGFSFEGFVIEEIIRHFRGKPEEFFFWRTHTGAELDLLMVRGQKKIGFEIKYKDMPQITKSMHIALNDLDLTHLYVVYPGQKSGPLGDKITALAFNDLPTLLKLP